ncbi:hypothetical protein [Alloactinosynnema sp. L-07]|uniref:hypothetical protein n=1 Tax=Alloactinosynnema sp. L-07 TaxID=1653480 RepID=UPI00065EF87B|nr:hypothetical protein [Alloactinosynnema sp. L-07]CRK61560.1 hypothetical protein [Alloactinosynnema sp. L-07]
MSEIELQISLSELDLNVLDDAVSADPHVRYKEGYENAVVEAAIIITAVIAGAKLILRVWKEFRGGTIVNLVTQPILVENDRDIPFGMFVVVTKDGKVQIEAKDEPKDSLERMISGFLELGINATKAAVQKIVDAATRSDDAAAQPAT